MLYKQQAFENCHAGDFPHAEFEECHFENCTLGNLTGAEFRECSFTNCTLELLAGTQLENSVLNKCEFKFVFRVSFKGSHITNSNFETASTILNGTFADCTWKGKPFKRPPIIIEGLEYPITVLDEYMEVGCQHETIEWFRNADNRVAAGAEGLRAARFWKRNKAWILEMLDQCLDKPVIIRSDSISPRND